MALRRPATHRQPAGGADAPANERTRDLLVMVSAVLVAFAVALVLNVHGRLGWEASAIAGFGVYALAAGTHILLRRMDEIARLRAELVALEGEVASLREGESGHGHGHGDGRRAAAGNDGFGLRPIPQPALPIASEPRLEPPPPQWASVPTTDRPGIDDPSRAGHGGESPRPVPQRRETLASEHAVSPRPEPGSIDQVAIHPPGPAPLRLEAPEPLDILATPPKAGRERRAKKDRGGFLSSLFRGENEPVEAPQGPSAARAREGAPPPQASESPPADLLMPHVGADASPIEPPESREAGGHRDGDGAPQSRRPRVVSGWQGSTPGVLRSLKAEPPPEPKLRLESALQSARGPLLDGGEAMSELETGGRLAASPAPRMERRSEAAVHTAKAGHPAEFGDEPSSSAAVEMLAEDGGPASPSPVDDMIREIAAKLTAQRAQELAEAARATPHDVGVEQAIDALAPRTTKDPHELRVSAAVAAGRVEIHLQPTLALEGLSTVSYEAYPVLRTEDGTLLRRPEYLSIAQRLNLLPGIERLALLRTIHVLQQLEQRGKLSPIFIGISSELLTDEAFFSEFMDAMSASRGLSTYLVLELSRASAAMFGPAELASLESLSQLGFTFALSNVESVELDFETLIERGLAFVKVPADVFEHGVLAGEAIVPTAEIKPLFEEAGLQLIVNHITSETQLDVVLAQGVVFGQGTLFAEPKPIKAQVLGEAPKAA